MKTIAIIGAGTLGKIIAEGVCSGAAGAWKLLGLTDCDEAGGRASAQKYRCAFYVDVPSLLAARPDVVIEAATAAVLKQWAGTILEHGVDMIALSAGALADDSFKELVEKACRASGAKLHIPSGAVGGFDLLSAARFAGDYSLVIRNLKPPEGLEGAPGLAGTQLSATEKQLVFRGTPAEAIAAFPKNVNVAVATAAVACVEDVQVEVWSVPGLKLNTHEICLHGEFGEAVLSIASAPSKLNPRSSALAGHSVLALLKKMDSPIQFE